MVAIFPVIGNACVAEDESHQIGEARLGANIVRQNDDASLAGLDADHGVGGLAVVAPLVKAVALRAVKDDDAQAGIKSLRCSLTGRSGERRELWPVVICSCGFVISAREAALRPSPRTSAAANFDKSEIVVFIEPAARTFLRRSCS